MARKRPKSIMKSGLDAFVEVVRNKPKPTAMLMIYTKYQVPKKERHHWQRMYDMVKLDIEKENKGSD